MSALTRISSAAECEFPWGISTLEILARTPTDHELRRLLDAANDGFAVVQTGHVVWANRAFLRMVGGYSGTIIGRPWLSLFTDRGFGLPKEGLEHVVECGLVREELEPAPVAVDRVGSPGDDSSGPAGAYQIRDLGPLRTLEEEVLRLGRQLHGVNREVALLRERLRDETAQREEFLTVVSHELRTPVTVITGYNRMLLGEQIGPLNEKQLRFLAESQKSCQRLNVFIGNLIDAAREASTVGPLEVVEAALTTSIENVAALVRPLLCDRALRLEVSVDPNCPNARFDPTRIEQVLTNLLSNAIQFAPRESEVLVIARPVIEAERHWVEVSVADLGPGVAPDQRQRIFEPYVQCEGERQAGGLGLGLAISKRIVEAHGGTIFVEDRGAGGARFAFRVPAVREVAE